MSEKRRCCKVCRRPLKTCFCDLVEPISTTTEVIIWQHPNERNHPKGSALLLHLCLPNSRLVVSERSSPEGLGIDSGRCALLYPGTTAVDVDNDRRVYDQILLLDGTWRKSRKMVYLNPWLQELPRVALADQSGAYTIRRAEAHYQLSTFEAAIFALQALEPNAQYAAASHAFTGFIARLSAFQPE